MPVEGGEYRIWSLVSKKFLQLVEESKGNGKSYKVECTGEGTESTSKLQPIIFVYLCPGTSLIG